MDRERMINALVSLRVWKSKEAFRYVEFFLTEGYGFKLVRGELVH